MEKDSKSPPRSSHRNYVIGALVGIIALGVGAWFVREAFLKVRNRAVECSMLGEARQISSATQQIFSEKNREAINVGELEPYLSGGRMSSGLSVSVDGVNFSGPYYRDVPGALKKGECFYVRSEFWFRDRSRMKSERMAEWAVDEHTMKFDVETGALAGTFH